MRISDWSSDVCSSDLLAGRLRLAVPQFLEGGAHLIGDGEPRLAFLERVEALDIAERVGPGGQLVALLPRKVEEDGEHLRRQFDRQFLDPVERLADRQ